MCQKVRTRKRSLFNSKDIARRKSFRIAFSSFPCAGSCHSGKAPVLINASTSSSSSSFWSAFDPILSTHAKCIMGKFWGQLTLIQHTRKGHPASKQPEPQLTMSIWTANICMCFNFRGVCVGGGDFPNVANGQHSSIAAGILGRTCFVQRCSLTVA